jgi:hypothetical protein
MGKCSFWLGEHWAGRIDKICTADRYPLHRNASLDVWKLMLNKLTNHEKKYIDWQEMKFDKE